MSNLLDQLSQITTIVADTGDLDAIRRLKPVDATTNPSLITKALSEPAQLERLKATVAKHGRTESGIDAAIDELTIAIGCDILGIISGRVSTEVDARLSYDTDATLAKAHQYIAAYEQAGISRERVLIKIASTWQGIQAAKQLEKEGIHCNLTLLFGMHQAKACADAGVTLISPFVGRILDWQKADENRKDVPVAEDKGVLSVKNIYQYYKQHGYATQVMGASFRSADQILALAGCDLLTIAPKFLDALAATEGTLAPALSSSMDFTPMSHQPDISEADFTTAVQADPITTDLLPKGIQGFVAAHAELAEKLKGL